MPLLRVGYHKPPPYRALSIGVLVMVLRGERSSPDFGNFPPASFAAVNARVWCCGAGLINQVECLMVRCLKQACIFIESHDRSVPPLPDVVSQSSEVKNVAYTKSNADVESGASRNTQIL